MGKFDKIASETVLNWLFKLYPDKTDYKAPQYLVGIIAQAIQQVVERETKLLRNNFPVGWAETHRGMGKELEGLRDAIRGVPVIKG